MSTDGELRQSVDFFARGLQNRVSGLQRELEQIKARQAQVEAQLNFARFATERAFNYVPKFGPDYQCPRCWVEHECRSALRAVRGSNDREDCFRCSACLFEISILV